MQWRQSQRFGPNCKEGPQREKKMKEIKARTLQDMTLEQFLKTSSEFLNTSRMKMLVLLKDFEEECEGCCCAQLVMTTIWKRVCGLLREHNRRMLEEREPKHSLLSEKKTDVGKQVTANR